MRRIRYAVAASLDGFIAGPNGEYDWIVMDPEIDFDAIYQEFDTILMGRRTFEVAGGGGTPGMQTFVCSRTLRQKDHPSVTIVSDVEKTVKSLRKQPGKDIWLFGGGQLFGSLHELGLVDTVEVAVIPVLLGAGVPLLPATTTRATLKLTGHKIYKKTGTVGLEYSVERAASAGGSRTAKLPGEKEVAVGRKGRSRA